MMLRKIGIFTKNILIIYKGLQKVSKNALQKYDLKSNHTMCPFYLMQNPKGLTATQLSEKIGIDKAAISRLLPQLIKSGYLEYCDFDGGKKYNVRMMLTEKGKVIARDLDRLISEYVYKFSTGVSKENIIVMYCSLKTIAANIINGVDGEFI